MSSSYSYVETVFGTYVRRNADQAIIPRDGGNPDYAAVLAWVAAGGVVDPLPGSTAGVASVPASITNFQARAMLLQMPSAAAILGRTLFSDVDDTLKAEGGVAWQAWEYANDITRDGALVASLGAKLGMSAAALDQFFITASGISA